MLKNITNLGITLNKEEQKAINGGIRPGDTICRGLYLTPDGTCNLGDYNHPELGHCVCCQG